MSESPRTSRVSLGAVALALSGWVVSLSSCAGAGGLIALNDAGIIPPEAIDSWVFGVLGTGLVLSTLAALAAVLGGSANVVRLWLTGEGVRGRLLASVGVLLGAPLFLPPLGLALLLGAFGVLVWMGFGTGHGRPLRIGGRARLAPVDRAGEGGDWAELPAVLVPGDPSLRSALAAAWTENAREEHAAIAAFSRLSLDLLAAGAPASLVDAAAEAARDEVRHARLAFGLATLFGGAPVGPAALPEAVARFDERPLLERLAVDSLVDGAVAEGLAALALAACADRCEDPALAALLRRTAEDEARHAALGRRILAWAREQGGAPVEAALARARAPAPRSRGELVSAGWVGAAELGALHARCLSELALDRPIPAPPAPRASGPLSSAPAA